MSNYLVTGGAGFIGSALLNKLILTGHNLVTIDNLSTGFIENIPRNVEFIRGDCSDINTYKKIPQIKFDAIIHIAGQSSGEVSFDDPIYDIKANTESTLLLLKFALQNGCSRFIYTSTMSVYGIKPDRPIKENDFCEPQSFYGVGKLASEHYLRIFQSHGINCTSLRLFNVYGPGQNMQNLRQGMVSIFLAQIIVNNGIHVKGSGDRFRDFIYIDDVIEAFLRTLSSERSYNKIINVATGIRNTVGNLVAILEKNFKTDIKVEYSGNTSGDIHGIYADIHEMKEILGDWDMTELNSGINKMIDYYCNND